MKVNIFVEKDNGGFKAIDLVGTTNDGGIEDILIQNIDESKMSAKKLLATRFLNFLANRALNMEKLLALPIKEQSRLRREFRESN